MKNKGMRQWIVVLWIICALLLTACSSSRRMSSEGAAPSPAAGSAADESVAQAQESEGAAESNRKIIARASLDLVVADTQSAVDEIGELIEEMGGYVSTSNVYRSTWDSSEALQGTITLRVPSENLEAALDALAGLAVTVESRSLNREDVTDQYSDVDAQIRNLEATEQELLAMLEEVRERPNSTSEDIMSVYRTLTEVRGEIETLRGRKNMWDNLISLSTIDVTLTPDSANLPVVEEGWRPAGVAREAQRALVSAVQVLGNMVIWFGLFVLPLVILALIPIAVAIWVLRWLLRKVSKPKPQVPSAPPAAPSV